MSFFTQLKLSGVVGVQRERIPRSIGQILSVQKWPGERAQTMRVCFLFRDDEAGRQHLYAAIAKATIRTQRPGTRHVGAHAQVGVQQAALLVQPHVNFFTTLPSR